MVDFNSYVRLGALLAIVCDDPEVWASTIRATARRILCFGCWDGRIEVYVTNPAAAMSAIEGITYRPLDRADALPPAQNRIRACVNLGSDSFIASDLKTGLLNQGMPILRYSTGPVGGEPYEVGCASIAELQQHLAMIFTLDRLAQRYASVSHAYARFALAIPGLTSWCRQLSRRAASNVDRCLRPEAA